MPARDASDATPAVSTGRSVLLVGLAHKNMSAAVEALNARGLTVRMMKALPAGSRSLTGVDGIDLARKRERSVPSWLPVRTQKILRSIDEDCVAIVARGGRRRGRDAALAARLSGVPIVIKTEFDVFWDPKGARAIERVRVIIRRLVESLVIRAFGVTRVSPTRGRGSVRQYGGFEYLPHSVSVTLSEPPPLPDTPLRVITVTRCPSTKNNAGLIDLAEKVRGLDVAFTVVFGEDSGCPKCGGTAHDDFQRAVAERGLASVVVLGPQDDLTELYRTHHVAMRNSTFEGANVTVIEGAAEGCVPIVSTTSGAGYGLFDDGSGYLVEASDLDGQARILQSLLEDVPLRETMRTRAMAAVRERCDPERFARLVERTIMGRGPRRT